MNHEIEQLKKLQDLGAGENLASHRHTGVDTPKVELKNLEGIHDYRVTFATATISNGTANVQNFTTGAARFGDYVLFGAPYSLNRVITIAYVSGSGTTTIMAHNQSNATVTLDRGVWNIRLIKS